MAQITLQDYINNIYETLGVDLKKTAPPYKAPPLYWHLTNITALLASGGSGGGGGGDYVKSMAVSGFTEEPLSTIKTVVDFNGLLFMIKGNSQWNFRSLDQFDFEELSADLIDFRVTDGSSGITVNRAEKTVSVYNLGFENQGRFFLVMPGAANDAEAGTEVDDEIESGVNLTFPMGVTVNFPVSRHLLVAKNAYAGVSDEDLAYLSQFIKFTRPAINVDQLHDIMELTNSIVANGQKYDRSNRQFLVDQSNDVEGATLEGAPLHVRKRILEIPMASDGVKVVNPLFVGNYTNLEELRLTTVPYHYA